MKPKLGTGKRFAKGVKSISAQEDLSEDDAKAIMAVAGRKKFGSSKMSDLARIGRKRKLARI